MKFVSYYGAVFKLTEQKYKKLLRDIRDSKDNNPVNYGKQIAIIECDITYMTSEDAKRYLSIIKP